MSEHKVLTGTVIQRGRPVRENRPHRGGLWPARIVAQGGRAELRAGKLGTGQLLGQVTDTPAGRAELHRLAGRVGLYVHAEEPAARQPVAGLLGVRRG